MHATFVYLHERCCRKKTPVAPGGPRDAEPFGAWMVSFDPVLTRQGGFGQGISLGKLLISLGKLMISLGKPLISLGTHLIFLGKPMDSQRNCGRAIGKA